ncbi:hypothetical protein [Microbacterium arabinogalactanolyticum]|uniref:Uncharacterized protein n=1 Tax=Microbacterium arabinogalactanolyticum TaxID=69365 RepID=A0ABQ5NEK1_9MICO|nr:hypothetical protein [Microbacterium arabinogalactanolyticum]GLC83865.1 hypothetical protein MIAR_04530 [Microbacterium arabinogalactanolyticum]
MSEDDQPSAPWIRRHSVGVVIGLLAIIALIVGVIGLIQISNTVRNSYAIEYGAVVSAEEYAAMVRAVITTTGSDEVFGISIDHAEAAASDTAVPDVTTSVVTAPTTSHPFGASWEWREGALVLISPLTGDDTPAGDGAFSLGDIDPEKLNAVDRRIRDSMPYGVTEATLTVQKHGDGPAIRVHARNRGTDDKVDARATSEGRIIEGTVCIATSHSRGGDVTFSCNAVK